MVKYMQIHFYRLLSIVVISFLLLPSTYTQAETLQQSVANCGNWEVDESVQGEDYRIKTTIITDISGSDCHGAFQLSNETDVRNIFGIDINSGGYTLEVIPYPLNANVEWVPAGDPDGKNYILPPLEIEIHSTPLDMGSSAVITLQGDMTFNSFAIDLSLFFLRLGMALIPGSGCIINEEQLMFTALRTSDILTTTAKLTLRGDIFGAREELLQVIDKFYEKAGETLKSIGVECGIDLFASLVKKPAAAAKIIIAWWTWVPVVITDYAKYKGHPAVVSLVYSPALNPTPTASAPTPSSTPLITPIPTLDLSDPESIVYWLAYDIANGTIDSFRKVIMQDELQYGTGFAGGRDSINKQTFLVELEKRITNIPQCVGYTISNKKIDLWPKNWQPVWSFRGGHKSEELVFSFFLYDKDIDTWAYFFPSSDILEVVDHQPCPEIGETDHTSILTQDGNGNKQYGRISNQVVEASLRTTPGYSGKNDNVDVIVKVQSGERIEIIGGPEEKDGLIWWNVTWKGYKGWIADHTASGRKITNFDP